MNEIIKNILDHGREFTFTQIMRLLYREVGKNADPEEIPLKLTVRPNLSMGHPASDLDNIRQPSEGENRKTEYQVTANFLGIYGSGTPLPSFYTEDLFNDEKEGLEAPRDFFDLLNNRFYHLLYEIQCKYRLYWRFFEKQDKFAREALFALTGFSPRAFRRGIDEYHVLRYASVYMQHPRCSCGLKSIATDVMQSNEIEIEQCVRRTASIPQPQRIQLGMHNTTLGEDAHVGMFIKDRMGKLRIHSGRVDEKEFPDLLPGSSRFQRLGKLIKSYVDTPLECEIGVRVKAEKIPAARLGGGWSRLGYETWVYSGKEMSDYKQVFFRL